jgi:hypothetical protein
MYKESFIVPSTEAVKGRELAYSDFFSCAFAFVSSQVSGSNCCRANVAVNGNPSEL